MPKPLKLFIADMAKVKPSNLILWPAGLCDIKLGCHEEASGVPPNIEFTTFLLLIVVVVVETFIQSPVQYSRALQNWIIFVNCYRND